MSDLAKEARIGEWTLDEIRLWGEWICGTLLPPHDCPNRARERARSSAMIRALADEVERLEGQDLEWVCIGCGYTFKAKRDEIEARDKEMYAHIDQCEKHPMSKLKAEVERLRTEQQEMVGRGNVGQLLRRGYRPVAPQCAGEGAQLIDGEWHMPRWGCDTLQNIIEEYEALTEADKTAGEALADEVERLRANALEAIKLLDPGDGA